MKAKINHILMLFLGVFGVSCDKLTGGDAIGEGESQLAEYGCPHATFVVKGRVTNEAGDPVKGIQVMPIEDGFWHIPMQEGKVYTDADGVYSSTFNNYPEGGGVKYKVTFEDVDGEENGGKFLKETLDLEFVQTEEGSRWFVGSFEAQADACLSLEAEESETSGSL